MRCAEPWLSFMLVSPMQIGLFSIPRISISVLIALPLAAAFADSSPDRAAVEMQIRQAIANWTAAANRGDEQEKKKIWAPGVQGWLPSAAEFKKAAAFSDSVVNEKAIRNTYTVTVNEVIVSTDLAVVRDTWEETVYKPGSSTTAHRTIQSFEVWQPQPDGQWKISRFIGAPRPWQRNSS